MHLGQAQKAIPALEAIERDFPGEILEAKLKRAEDPTWLQHHSVLGVDFGRDPQPIHPPDPVNVGIGGTRSLKSLKQSIEYQLGERLGFVAAPDPIVADLLFDLGNILAFIEVVEVAAAVYDESLKFSSEQKQLVRERRSVMGQIAAEKHRLANDRHAAIRHRG